jgi:TetR/AcrR family transcriptional regulator, cholesterol catabolism regulator
MPRPGRKENVVEAAVTLFSKKGYHGTTVRDIAVQSGMLSGSLYAHISSKEDLLFEIVSKAADQFMAAVEPIVTSSATAEAKLRQAMAAHIRVVEQNREAATVFMHEWKALSSDRRDAIAERRNSYEQLFAVILAEGVQEGAWSPIDHRFARLLILSAVNWLYQWYDPAGPLGPDAVADKFADLIMLGLKGGGQ